MVIESRSIVSGAVALALVGVAAWVSTMMFSSPSHSGSVEVTQIGEPAWAVEVKQIAEDTTARTASR